MRILMVNPYALPHDQAGGTRHASLARVLADLGHDVVLAASAFDHTTRRHRLDPGQDHRLERDGRVAFLQLRTPGYRGNGAARLWNMLAFGRRVARDLAPLLPWTPDVVLGSSPHLIGAWAALRLARSLGVPFVLEVRDVWPQSLVDVMGVPRWHPVVRALEVVERDLYRNADRVVSLLPAFGRRLAERGGDPTRLDWVPNGIDLDLAPDPGDPPERSPFTLLYAGSHNRTNALDILLDAAALLRDRRPAPPLRLVFLGDGSEKPALEARARDLGLEVLFLPPVPKREVYAWLARADAFWIATRPAPLWAYGVSFNKIFDFMAMSRPTVLGLAGANNPVEEAGAGITVAPGDPEAMALGVQRLLALPREARLAMGRRARAHVEAHYDLRILGRRLEGALVRALEGRAAHAC